MIVLLLASTVLQWFHIAVDRGFCTVKFSCNVYKDRKRTFVFRLSLASALCPACRFPPQLRPPDLDRCSSCPSCCCRSRRLFMFRPRRSVLAKRLWKCRIEPASSSPLHRQPGTQRSTGTGESDDERKAQLDEEPITTGEEHEEGCCYGRGFSANRRGSDGIIVLPQDSVGGVVVGSNSSTASTMVRKEDAFIFFERLGTSELELLLTVVRSAGDEATGCIPSPYEGEVSESSVLPPHLLCCRLFRWPQEGDGDERMFQLRKMPGCAGRMSTTVCCNPYHWSRVHGYPYSSDDDSISVSDSESQKFPDGSSQERSSTLSSGELSGWCTIAYWELRQRVGPQFVVHDDHVDVFGELTLGSGLCLAQIQSTERDVSSSVARTRRKIGSGLVLSREPDGVWVYNRSRFPVFVSRPFPPSKSQTRSSVAAMASINRLPPGSALRIFDGRGISPRDIPAHDRTSPLFTPDGPCNLRSAQISFAKGWGDRYSRRSITSCPCWIEVLLGVNR